MNYGPDYRIYYVQRGDEFIVLLAGGDKSSQAQDIRDAKAPNGNPEFATILKVIGVLGLQLHVGTAIAKNSG